MSIRIPDEIPAGATTCGPTCDRQHTPDENHNTNQPTLARRILDLPDEATHAFIGMVAAHFATGDWLDRTTVVRYVDEALAVSS